MLYFGSFNPIHCGHVALAEYVVSKDLCDELIMVVSPQNPLKSKVDLAPELERFMMAEIACAESSYPDRIKPSLIEFMLPKPSYTIDTLNHLKSEYGSQMEFSILMGGDIVEQLPKWKSYEEILDNYTIYLYPRPNESVDRFRERMIYLEDAPQFEISSSECRRRLMRGEETDGLLSPAVVKHIKDQGLWSSESYEEWITRQIESDPNNASNYMERATWHYKNARWGSALNDFKQVVSISPDSTEAQEAEEMARMAREILEFRYTDIYNP